MGNTPQASLVKVLFEKGLYMHIQHGPGSSVTKSSECENEEKKIFLRLDNMHIKKKC